MLSCLATWWEHLLVPGLSSCEQIISLTSMILSSLRADFSTSKRCTRLINPTANLLQSAQAPVFAKTTCSYRLISRSLLVKRLNTYFIFITGPNFTYFSTLSTWPGEIGSRLAAMEFWRAWRQLSRTFLSNFLSAGALATRTRCEATAFVETSVLVERGGHCEAPSRRSRDQLFLLEWVKFIWAVDSSHLALLAASKDSINWSAMSRTPDVSYSSSSAFASSSMHGMYMAWHPHGTAVWAALSRARLKRL